MIRVGVNGFGTIGKRVADAIVAQPDMELVGVGKTSPNYEATLARRRGYPLYALADRHDRFAAAGIELAGDVDDLVAASDVIVDATPSGIGAENQPRYERHDTPAIYQGGEDAAIVETSFTARANYADAVDADAVRVVSCNTTGLARLLTPLEEAYGIEKARVTLVRRGGDPAQTGRGPINDTLPDPVTLPSHHGPDLRTVLDVPIDTLGLKVPATLAHTHSVNVTLTEPPADAAAVHDRLADERRLLMVPEAWGVDGAGKLLDYAKDTGRDRGDLYENAVWAESITLEGADLYLFQAIHQESDVVPENIDAVRAVTGTVDAAQSTALTDDTLGVGTLR